MNDVQEYTEICNEIILDYSRNDKKLFSIEPLDVFRRIVDRLAYTCDCSPFDITKPLYKWEIYEDISYYDQMAMEAIYLFYRNGILEYQAHCLKELRPEYFINGIGYIDLGEKLEKLYLTNPRSNKTIQVDGRYFYPHEGKVSSSKQGRYPCVTKSVIDSPPGEIWLLFQKNIFEKDKVIHDELSPSTYFEGTVRLKSVAVFYIY